MSMPLLAAKLVELRQSKGLSQKDLADYLNISREAYSNYERATREPNLEVVCKLAKLYEIDVSELVNERNVMPHLGAAHSPSLLADVVLRGLANRSAAAEGESTITKNMNHLLKLLTGKNSTLDLTEVTKEDLSVLDSYKKLDKQAQKEVREFIRFKHSLNRARS